jgi:hypothetical protein
MKRKEGIKVWWHGEGDRTKCVETFAHLKVRTLRKGRKESGYARARNGRARIWFRIHGKV